MNPEGDRRGTLFVLTSSGSDPDERALWQFVLWRLVLVLGPSKERSGFEHMIVIEHDGRMQHHTVCPPDDVWDERDERARDDHAWYTALPALGMKGGD